MKFPLSVLRPRASRALVCLLALSYFAATPPAAARGDKDWKPVDPAEIATSAPAVEKDADAEALFWEVKVADQAETGGPRTVLQHYIRIKIFNERGRESQSKVDIFAPKVGGREIKISDIAGRTIRPDGTVVELKKEDIFERTVVKTSGLKVKAKSFAMPGVEPGSIIEYRWREVRGDSLSQYDRLEFSRDIPVRLVKYYIKPISVQGYWPYGMRAQTFNGQNTPFQKERDGYYSTMMENVPAFREEPYMPPEYAVRPWMLIYYTEDRKLDAARFWKEYGKETYQSSKSEMKAGDEVKRKAAEVIGDASTPEQKLERLFEFCRTQIKNVHDDASGLTAEQRAKVKENKSPSDTLKRGVGTGYDIDMLFAALATAAGFEARLARLADRGDTFFNPSFPDAYFVRTYNIAVRVGDAWRFYDPASTHVPFGMLRWQEEGQQALLADPNEPTFVVTPTSGPEKSLERRSGSFKLSEDGTLEGEVRIEYTGHLAVDLKEYNDDDSPAEREETLRNKLKGRLAGAEITDVKVENANDPAKPFVYAFRVRVPDYAQRTGKRLFFQPAFFQKGVAPRFPTAGRRHEVYFRYAWSEEDQVEFELPEGFTLENAESPAPFSGGELSKYDASAAVTKDGRKLIYRRKFFFGGGSGPGLMLFPTTSYQGLKNYFDLVSKQDGHTFALRQGAAAN